MATPRLRQQPYSIKRPWIGRRTETNLLTVTKNIRRTLWKAAGKVGLRSRPQRRAVHERLPVLQALHRRLVGDGNIVS